MLFGTDAPVRTAFESKGEGKFADDPEFKAAFGTVRGLRQLQLHGVPGAHQGHPLAVRPRRRPRLDDRRR